MFTKDNIVKQDFKSVRSFDNCDGYLNHTKINCHTLLIGQGSQTSVWAVFDFAVI